MYGLTRKRVKAEQKYRYPIGTKPASQFDNILPWLWDLFVLVYLKDPVGYCKSYED